MHEPSSARPTGSPRLRVSSRIWTLPSPHCLRGMRRSAGQTSAMQAACTEPAKSAGSRGRAGDRVLALLREPAEQLVREPDEALDLIHAVGAMAHGFAAFLAEGVFGDPAEALAPTRRQARDAARKLVALPHLRNGDTLIRLDCELEIGVTTAWRYIRKAIDLLAATAGDLDTAMHRVRLPAQLHPRRHRDPDRPGRRPVVPLQRQTPPSRRERASPARAQDSANDRNPLAEVAERWDGRVVDSLNARNGRRRDSDRRRSAPGCPASGCGRRSRMAAA